MLGYFPRLSVPFLLSAALAAQAASYATFGDGCNGTPPSTCLAINDQNPTHQLTSLPNEYAYPFVNTTGSAMQILGFEIYTTTNTGLVETGRTGFLRDNSGAGATVHTLPAPTNSANGTITVQPQLGWYSTSIHPPMIVQPGEAFWLHCDAYSRIAPPMHTTGGVNGPAANYWRRPPAVPNWAATGSVFRQIIRVRCVAAAPPVPTVTALTPPALGTTHDLAIAGGPPSQLAILVHAFSRTQGLGLPTPVAVSAAGAPGCYVHTSTDLTSLVVLDPNGAATFPFAIPNNPALTGFTWHNQVAALAPGANPLGILLSNGGTAIVGT